MIGYETRKEMRDRVCRLINDTSTGRQTKVNDWLAHHYKEAGDAYDWPQLVRISEERVSVVAGSKFVYLPKDVEQILVIMPTNQAQPLLNADPSSLYRASGVDFNVNGPALRWADAGDAPKRVEFSAAGENLSVAQTGYSATSTAFVSGIITAAPGDPTSLETSETVTVSASSGVYTSLGGGNTYYDVSGFSVQSNDSGYYSLRGVTTGTVYAVISPGDTTVRYRRIRLMNAPDAALTVTFAWKKRLARLTNDNQSVEIPVSGSIIEKTIATMYHEQREWANSTRYDTRAENELARAYSSAASKGQTIELGQPMPRQTDRWIHVVNAPNP